MPIFRRFVCYSFIICIIYYSFRQILQFYNICLKFSGLKPKAIVLHLRFNYNGLLLYSFYYSKKAYAFLGLFMKLFNKSVYIFKYFQQQRVLYLVSYILTELINMSNLKHRHKFIKFYLIQICNISIKIHNFITVLYY